MFFDSLMTESFPISFNCLLNQYYRRLCCRRNLNLQTYDAHTGVPVLFRPPVLLLKESLGLKVLLEVPMCVARLCGMITSVLGFVCV